MFISKKEEIGLGDELGLTYDRIKELTMITRTIIDKYTNNEGYGRTSHVLLEIVGRKDLTDLEKVACTFVFTNKIAGEMVEKPTVNDLYNLDDILHIDEITESIDMLERMTKDMSKKVPRVIIPLGATDFDFIDPQLGIAGKIITPQNADMSEMLTIIMAIMMSILGNVPKPIAKRFCETASKELAKIAIS